MENENPKISVIIPSLKTVKKLQFLLNQIKSQTEQSVEVLVVYKVSPSGKARNKGAFAAKGRFLVFIDDDVQLGSVFVLSNLVNALESGADIGLVGASTLLPLNANRFQKRVSKEIPRMTFPVVDELTESDMVTTQCWAQMKEVFREVGPFTESINRGVDPEYRHRVRSNGYRIVIAPDTFTYHPPPKNFRALCRQSWRNGYASALAQRYHPQLVVSVPDSGFMADYKESGFASRIIKSIGSLLTSIAALKCLKACERMSYAAGYLIGRLEKRKK